MDKMYVYHNIFICCLKYFVTINSHNIIKLLYMDKRAIFLKMSKINFHK